MHIYMQFFSNKNFKQVTLIGHLDLKKKCVVICLSYFKSYKMKLAAGLVIFRRIVSTSNNFIEYLLLQTSYGEHHWVGCLIFIYFKFR